MMKKARYFFSMLEVVLAVTVVGAGLTLMLVMFPVALRCARDTVSNNYVPMIASSFIAQTNAVIDADGKKFTDTNSWVHQLPLFDASSGVSNDIPAVPDVSAFLDDNIGMGSGNIATAKGNVKITYRGSRERAGKSSSSSRASDAYKKEPMSLYSYEMNGKDAGYVVLFKSFNPRNDTGIPAADRETYDKIDFAACVTIEKQQFGTSSGSGSLDEEFALFRVPLVNGAINSEGNLIKGTSSSLQASELNKNYARLRMTIAWPLEASPEARNRRVYIMDKSN